MKKKIITISLSLLLIIGIGISYWCYKSNETFTYEWVAVEDSSIGQYRLYINDSKGKHIDGSARLVFINGKTKKVDIDKEGLLYVKGIVSEVRNPKKR